MKNNRILVALFCILSSILLANCDNKQNIKCISVKYYIDVFETIASISYEELQNAETRIDTFECLPEIIRKKDKDGNWVDTMIPSNRYCFTGIKDTTITNPQALVQIQQAISKLKVSPVENAHGNVRTICIIEYQNGEKDSLYIEGKYTENVNVNKHSCENDLELIYLIKKYSGFYSWLDESMLRLFYELEDTCFQDTLIDNKGQKYWRGKDPPLI